MTPTELYRSFAPSIAHIVVTNNGNRISSGSGFIIENKLVTCGHMISGMRSNAVSVRFPHASGMQNPLWNFPNGFDDMRCAGFSDANSYDYAIFEPPAGMILGPSLRFAQDEPDVGSAVCALGFPFERDELTLGHGLISAAVNSGVARLLKLDMSINPSNSGGPLINLENGEVVGVVARKATGLSAAFDRLRGSFDQNIEILNTVRGLSMGGIDPFEVFRVTQAQMKIVATELERSAQVGIGWAVYVDPLRSERAFSR